MNAQFKKGVLELVVLLIIHQNDEYGYSLVKKISSRMDITEGTVYPILRRLVKEEYVTTYQQASADGPSRKYYRITSIGKEKLASLTSEWQEFTGIIDFFIKESDQHEQT